MAMMTKDSDLIREFLDSDEHGYIDELTEENKSSLIVFFSHKTAYRTEIILGLIVLWTIIATGALLINFIWGG